MCVCAHLSLSVGKRDGSVTCVCAHLSVSAGKRDGSVTCVCVCVHTSLCLQGRGTVQ